MNALRNAALRLLRFREFARDERGATAIEYGLIVALIFLAAVTAIKGYATKTNTMYSTISSNLTAP